MSKAQISVHDILVMCGPMTRIGRVEVRSPEGKRVFESQGLNPYQQANWVYYGPEDQFETFEYESIPVGVYKLKDFDHSIDFQEKGWNLSGYDLYHITSTLREFDQMSRDLRWYNLWGG